MVLKALVTLFSTAAGEWLAAKKYENHELFDEILELYFDVSMFLTAAELYNERFTTIIEIKNDVTVTLFPRGGSFTNAITTIAATHLEYTLESQDDEEED